MVNQHEMTKQKDSKRSVSELVHYNLEHRAGSAAEFGCGMESAEAPLQIQFLNGGLVQDNHDIGSEE
jgi:hypothetical protein